MFNLESRLIIVERAIRSLQDQMQQLAARVGALEQNQWNSGAGGASGGGGGQNVFFCMAPSTGSWGATGTWPALTAGSFTADVYLVSGAAINLATSGATINNWFPASPANSLICEVEPDGSGDYVTVTQSCS